MEQIRTNGAALAMMAAAGLLGAACGKKGDRTAPAATAAASELVVVYCAGVNSCAGKSECRTAKYGCAARNACKGRGIVKMTAKECESKGGNVTDPNLYEARRPTTVDKE